MKKVVQLALFSREVVLGDLLQGSCKPGRKSLGNLKLSNLEEAMSRQAFLSILLKFPFSHGNSSDQQNVCLT
jgi:hypothetical protein